MKFPLKVLIMGWVILGLGGSARLYADAPQAVGDSPTAYTSAQTDAQKELQSFQRLTQLRDSGRISPIDYQGLLLQIAAGNKRVRFTGLASAQPIDPIIISHIPGPLYSAQPKPVAPIRVVPISVRFPLPTSRRPHKMTTIQRPGPIRAVIAKDVAPLYTLKGSKDSW